MNVSTAGRLGSLSLLLAGTISPYAAYAAGNTSDTQSATGTEVAEAPEAALKVPESIGDIWEAIDLHFAELGKDIQTGILDKVHQHAFAIRDLAVALPPRSRSLPPDKLAQLNSNLKFVATLAQRLDATGDAGDRAGTQANFAKLKTVLEEMRAVYP